MKSRNTSNVASFTDAWIETNLEWCDIYYNNKSHLLQMRGLKLVMDMWGNWMSLSHLLQMRGLKLCFIITTGFNHASHLLQMRGLKLTSVITPTQVLVASFTDAWIETYLWYNNPSCLRRIFYRCVD